MEMIDISKLKTHKRNLEFFDDIEGDRWNDFKESIVRRGVVEPIVVTQDLLIVSGHQRVKGCKEIGLLEIPCRITYYPDYDEKYKRTKEDMVLEDLICTNIMQRGVGNVNPMKMAKCIMELERIKGVKHGGDRKSSGDNLDLEKQSDIANQLQISQRQLGDYKKLTNLIPELQQMVENGSMKATVGYKIWAKMTKEEQEEFFNEIGREKIKTLTQKATQELLDSNNQLENELNNEKSKPKEKEIIEKIIEVDNTDYSMAKKYRELERKHEELENQRRELIAAKDRADTRLQLMTNKADAYKQDSRDYERMKEELTYLTKQKDDVGRKLQSINDISGLVVEIDHMLKGKLAPVKYSRSLLEAKDDEIVIENLTDIVHSVQSWIDEMKQYIPNKINYVEVI